MNELVFLLEEASAKALLQELMPRLVSPEMPIRYIVFEGKQDLDRQIERRLQHYRAPDARFVILRDKDMSDCRNLKEELLAKCENAGRTNALVRIACHELESWYLADLAAVEQGLGIQGLARKQSQRKFRDPDALANAAQELSKLTAGRYQKVSGSRAIGPHLDLTQTRSKSFSVFINGLKRIIASA